MNWKVFTAASVSLSLLVSVPQNGISCGPTEDPQDYFTSFFDHKTAGNERLRPYYYTSLAAFYDAWDDEDTAASRDPLLVEWAAYLKCAPSDARWLVYESKPEEIGPQKPRPNPQTEDSTRKILNPQLLVALRNSNPPVLQYLNLAKRVESFTNRGPWDDPIEIDSSKVNGYLQEADRAWRETRDPFLKAKYAFQRCKIAFYNRRYTDCIRFYDEGFQAAGPEVQKLALSYKAGSMNALGKGAEAALMFSRIFEQDARYRRMDFQGFKQTTDGFSDNMHTTVLALTANNRERATVSALFGIGGDSALARFEQAYQFDPTAPLLPLLAVRVINQLEESFLTPLLHQQQGGMAYYFTFQDGSSIAPEVRAEVMQLQQLLLRISNDPAVPNRALHGAGAAYLSFMNGNLPQARTLVAAARRLKPDAHVTDQLQLIDLLVLASESGAVNADREAQMLPSVQWLMNKAKTDEEYARFSRNFFSEILAQRYEQQNERHKAALAYGLADGHFRKTPEELKEEEDYPDYTWFNGVEYLQDQLSSGDAEQLYRYFENRNATAWERMMMTNSTVTRDKTIEVLGTTFIREQNWSRAIEWLRKAGTLPPLTSSWYNEKTAIEQKGNIDPFYDYLNDWQRYDKRAAKPWTKLSFSEKMLDLQKRMDTIRNADARAKAFYQYASGLYNMSYYGNAWRLVSYHRSTADNINDDKNPSSWEAEYYEVSKTRQYYQKAFDAAVNREFKAACLFMVAKCNQRQIAGGGWYDFETSEFWPKYHQSDYFPQFKKEFGNTKFYQYAFTRCSYLRDYVKKTANRKTTSK